MFQARIGGDLDCSSGHFSNPSGLAIEAWGADVTSSVFLSSIEVEQESGSKGSPFQAEGLVRFISAHVGTDFLINQARFLGNTSASAAPSPSSSANGLYAALLSVKGLFSWLNIELGDGAKLDLSSASITPVVDQERSWPAPGNLLIDGLPYRNLYSVDTQGSSGYAVARLR